MAMQLVDSTALAAALPHRVLPPTTFSIWYDSTGRLTHALALSDSLVARGGTRPDSGALARAEMATLIADAAFPQDSAEMHVRLTIARDSAGGMSLAVARSMVCPVRGHPAFHPPNERFSATRDDIEDLRRAVPAAVSFVVDSTGHPLELLVTQSSGSRIIDDQVVNSINSTRFDPATIDGFPKKVTITLHILPPIPRP
jgi:TonB family protein